MCRLPRYRCYVAGDTHSICNCGTICAYVNLTPLILFLLGFAMVACHDGHGFLVLLIGKVRFSFPFTSVLQSLAMKLDGLVDVDFW